MSEIRFEVGGTRCFGGLGYSGQDCSQSFGTFEEADAHRVDEHAVPERAYIMKITEEEVFPVGVDKP